MKIKFEHYIIAYLLGAILTFGHAYGSATPKEGISPTRAVEQKTVGAFIAALGWPLYVSAQMWSDAK